jgi:hypothetical protein
MARLVTFLRWQRHLSFRTCQSLWNISPENIFEVHGAPTDRYWDFDDALRKCSSGLPDFLINALRHLIEYLTKQSGCPIPHVLAVISRSMTSQLNEENETDRDSTHASPHFHRQGLLRSVSAHTIRPLSWVPDRMPKTPCKSTSMAHLRDILYC